MVKEDGDGGGDRQVFAGVSYRLLGFDDNQDLERLYKETIEKRGGKFATKLSKGNCTHLITYSETIVYDNPFCLLARKHGIIVVNELWVENSVSNRGLADTKKVLYWPVKELGGISGSLHLHISASGYSLDRSKEIQRMVHFMGASFYEKWTEKVTHLISYECEGWDYNLAKKSKAHVVNHKWLEDCLKKWKLLPIDNYNISLELELLRNQSKGANKQLVFSPKTLGRQYSTPQSKSSSVQTSRKAYSVGTKRPREHVDYENIVKCKRSLNYGSSSTTEITMHEYAKCGLIQSMKLPYMQNEKKMSKEGIKLVLLNVFGLVVDLHYQSKTLKGLFSSKNFLICLRTKKTTLLGIEPQADSHGDGTIDKLHFVVMVKDMFGDDLPQDLKIWLECIENGAHDNIVRRHINMLHANNIFGEFCMMYHALLEMKTFDEEKFDKMMRSLKAYDNWVPRTFNWCVLESNRRYKDPKAEKTEPTLCEANTFGLMQQLWNCWEHPAKFYKHFLMAILMDEFPKLLSDVQAALYAAGYLPQLDTKNLD